VVALMVFVTVVGTAYS